MDTMQEARDRIRQIDSRMSELFLERMDAVREIARYKGEHGLPVEDRERENQLLNRAGTLIQDPVLREYYVRFQEHTMAVSKQYQHRLLEGARIAYSGIAGAFAHIAARRIFPDGTPVPCASFEEAYRAVEKGLCDCAVLPIENSFAGEVGQVTDLMFSGRLYVNGVYDLHITQNLLGIPGASLADVKTVISHPQALAQCHTWITAHGLQTVSAENTAVAARIVAEKKDPSLAAVASYETAVLYGLTVLDHDINDSLVNTTRFAVFSRAEAVPFTEAKSRTFILLFSVRDEAGALAKAIQIIGQYGFNMKALRSRPMKDLPWHYYFYVEAEGDETSGQGREMFKALSAHCDRLKVVGHYIAGNPAPKEEEE